MITLRRFKFIIILLGIITIAIIVSSLVAFIILRNHKGVPSNIFSVTLIINYDNLRAPEEDIFYLNVSDGTSALVAFSRVAELDIVNYSFGCYVRGVNGYYEDLPDHYWAFYYFDFASLSWVYSNLGLSNYFITHEDMLKLQYL